MKKVAITGNIGSGKTTISKFLLEKKFRVFECDYEINKLYKTKNLKREIKKFFHKSIDNLIFKNGRINKQALSKYVFSKPKELRKLEKIIYIQLEKNKSKFILKNEKQKILFFDVPLLFEKKQENNYDYVIYLYVENSAQRKRVMNRKGMDEKKFKDILKYQKNHSNSDKVSLKINTNVNIEVVKKTVLNFIEKLS